MTKEERLDIIQVRLGAAVAASNYEEALALISEVIKDVEDEFSGIPVNPNGSREDGRLYPPQEDNKHSVKGKPRVQRLRSKAHNTYIGDNGSIEICLVSTKLSVLSKAGADGYHVKDL